MRTAGSPASTSDDGLFQETPMELGTGDLASETMLPARHVVWLSVVLIAVTVAVLAFG
jgi:hypothetical protein